MSHLRAPAARADRREGGRHGRPVARPAPSLPETHIRPQLLRLAVLPPIAVALSGCAAVLFTVRSTGARPGLVLWGVLGGALSVTLAGILIAAVAADRAAKTVSDRVGALRRGSARREAELRALVEGLRRGEVPPGRGPRSGPPDNADDFELLAADLARAHDGAVTAVVQAAQLSSQAGSEQKLEVFVNLARRLQSLVHREISILDELENEIEDPDLLKGLFHVDHLATRIRRHAENLAVLGGAVSRRQWSNPVSMTEVLRSAIAEVEQYSRVKLVPPIDGTLRGHAVADVIHLLAELVENATVFSAPHTQVLLRANLVTSGLAVEVEDRGLGMPVAEQHRMNALLTDPDQVNVASLLADGRIGLFVVSQLAKRHGIHVRLQTNIYGGVQAVLVVPQALLGSAPGAVGAQPPEGVGAAGVTGVAVLPQGAQPRPGNEARHRGAPAEPRTGSDPQRRDSRAGAGASDGRGARTNLNGGSASKVNGGGAGAPGAGRAVNGRGAVAEGREAGRSGGGGRVPSGGRMPGSDARGDGHPSEGRGLASGGNGLASGGGGGGGTREPGTGGRATDGRGTAPGNHGASPDGGTAGSLGGEHVPGGASLPGGEPFADGGSAPTGGRAVPNGSGAREGRPAPLPVRGARAQRPNPAEAVPGIRPDDRRLVAEHVTAPPTPRAGTVRGTMGKPQLPRRRAQEHIAPQLRGGPAPRQDAEYPAGHDPGLMAAFQRGISLAEAQQHLEQTSEELDLSVVPPDREPDHRGPSGTDHVGLSAPGHMASTDMGSADTGRVHLGVAHMGSADMDAPDTGGMHRASDHTEVGHMASAHTDPAHTDSAHTDPAHTEPGSLGAVDALSGHLGTDPLIPAHTHTTYTGTGTGPLSALPSESRRAPSPEPTAAFDFGLGLDLGASHTGGTPTTESAATDVTPMERPHISDAHGLDPDRTTPRHDGSAPAG